jgi:hypothetical protein
MGLFKDILSGAVSDSIGKVVGQAVEKAVTPAAERLAQKQAEAIDKLAEKTEQAVAESSAAIDKAAADVADAANAAESAQKQELTPEQQEQARQAAQALKGFGMMFSGAVAQAKKEAEEAEAAKKAAEKAIFENWDENLGNYPLWDVGGSEFELEEQTPMNGYPAWRFSLKGRPYLMELYMNKLRAAGFTAMHCSNPLDLNADTYFKMIDGVCFAFNRSDACNDGWINVSFYVDNYVPKPQKPVQQNAELKNLAKGLFKKLF